MGELCWYRCAPAVPSCMAGGCLCPSQRGVPGSDRGVPGKTTEGRPESSFPSPSCRYGQVVKLGGGFGVGGSGLEGGLGGGKLGGGLSMDYVVLVEKSASMARKVQRNQR